MGKTAKLKVAIAGAGMVTHHHIMAWNRLPQVEIAAIYARHLTSARKRADEFRIPAAYDDVATMLDMELLIHHLDTIRYLLGPVRVVAAHSAKVCPEVSGEDAAFISLQADNGALGTVSGNLCAAGFPPLPADRLDNLQTLQLVEDAYRLAGRPAGPDDFV